jgi:hypothetical protein
MDHFMVSVPRKAEPITNQAVRDHIADTLEASQHHQRFTDIEEVPRQSLEIDPARLAESMKRISEADALDKERQIADGKPAPVAADTSDLKAAMKKLTAGEAMDEPLPPTAPDYSEWFKPTKHSSSPQPEESWLEAVVALFGCFKWIAQGLATAIWLLAALIFGASALKASLQIWEWLN